MYVTQTEPCNSNTDLNSQLEVVDLGLEINTNLWQSLETGLFPRFTQPNFKEIEN